VVDNLPVCVVVNIISYLHGAGVEISHLCSHIAW